MEGNRQICRFAAGAGLQPATAENMRSYHYTKAPGSAPVILPQLKRPAPFGAPASFAFADSQLFGDCEADTVGISLGLASADIPHFLALLHHQAPPIELNGSVHIARYGDPDFALLPACNYGLTSGSSELGRRATARRFYERAI